jgi:hypothetical protein
VLFLSYARTDVVVTDQLFLDLQRAKHDPWRDLEVTGGQRWWSEILERIRSCDVFVFLLSRDSIKSRSCRAELEYAVALGRSIVPVLVGEVSIDMAPTRSAKLRSSTFEIAHPRARLRSSQPSARHPWRVRSRNRCLIRHPFP